MVKAIPKPGRGFKILFHSVLSCLISARQTLRCNIRNRLKKTSFHCPVQYHGDAGVVPDNVSPTKCVGIQNMARGAATKCVGYKIW